MKKISQKQMCFYKLYEEWRKEPERYVAAWEFGGEMYIKELNRWVMMSYKCPTRLTDIFQENPNLLERSEITGKSGATYFGYRFVPDVSMSLIKDPQLVEFYRSVKQGELGLKIPNAK